MRNKLVYSIWIFLIIIFCFNVIEASEQIYYPYPIIFVHGINSNVSTWDYTKGQLEIYFKDKSGYKYPFQDTKYKYFPLCDYQRQNKGDISNIAITFLKHSIELALKSFPSEVPEDKRKVIIVAHSMGGLVTRSLLKQGLGGYYASKIDRIVFIGTPHLGSPWANSVWLLNKIRKEIVNPAVKDYSAFYSQNVGTRFTFADTSYSLQITGLPSQANNYLLAMLGGEQGRLNRALSWPDGEGLSDSIAVEQLRLNQDVNFKKTILWATGVQKTDVELKESTVGSETFIGKASENLATPGNFKTIRGENPIVPITKIVELGIAPIYELYNNCFTFPSNLSLYDAINTGDGIVPQASQGGIGGGADYFVNAFHTNEPNTVMEESQERKLLQAIDDKPSIESIRVEPEYTASPIIPPPVPTYNYVVVKLKDYLLADIEIVEMKVNGQTVDLSSFQDPITQTYKPYVKYPDKAFLKERTDTEASFPDRNPLVLQPGEFWVRIDTPYIYNVFVKVKNPAGKETFKEIVRPHYLNSFKQASAQGTSQQGFSFEDISALAYNNYISSQPNPIDENIMWLYELWLYSIGVEAYSYLSPYEVDGQIEYDYNASIWRFSGPCLAFRFDSPLDKIKPFKLRFTGRPHGETGFDILVYHDPSNNWPPSETGELVSSFSSLSLFQPIEINVDPQDIGPNGYYTLRFKADLPEANYIPYPTIPTGHGLEGAFLREAEICHDGYITIEPEEGGSP